MDLSYWFDHRKKNTEKYFFNYLREVIILIIHNILPVAMETDEKFVFDTQWLSESSVHEFLLYFFPSDNAVELVCRLISCKGLDN